ncbi:lamin tail domain-containing protein [Botrimarina hoheduenensis]|uniref:LTD domain-containing protein n=1 Tax=Botrimarina hoheduenensis TaxID=2528000 RepID=A0A5C5VVL9_9BACT|nr:lamin tail domain-containing protein [Botrimarina hoheduenensis]TWT42716.1 hypothetical protein Pla111_26890 [Botrimarina hoheduenensis]
MKSVLMLSVLVAASSTALATPMFKITEVFVGLSGEDGTQDWIEVTNFGTSAGDTSDLYYDDSTPSLANAGQLTSYTLAPGESAVFLLDINPIDAINYPLDIGNGQFGAVDEFNALWGPGITIGLTNGGGNLGQSGDQANLLNSAGDLIDAFDYTGGGDLATFEDPTGMGPATLSVLGLNGAYESAPFFNDNLGLPNDTAVLVGSPGTAELTIPEPATIALCLLTLATAATARARS